MQNNFDRGIIKWAPFNALATKNDLINEKNEVKKPCLSDDQISIIEKNLILAYYEKQKIIISYYQDNQINTQKEIIKKIDFTYHKIYLSKNVILFNQIINITFL